MQPLARDRARRGIGAPCHLPYGAGAPEILAPAPYLQAAGASLGAHTLEQTETPARLLGAPECAIRS